MSEKIYLEIDTLSPEDRKSLFSAVCSKIALDSELNVIRKVLKIPMHHTGAKGFQPTMSDIVALIDFYQIPYEFRLKLAYFEQSKETEKRVSEMEQQKEEITNEALKVKPRVINFKEVERKTINPNQLPEIELDDL